MLKEDKEKLLQLVSDYDLDEVLRYLSNFAIKQSDDACDSTLPSAAKRWTAYSLIIDNAIIEIRKIRK